MGGLVGGNRLMYFIIIENVKDEQTLNLLIFNEQHLTNLPDHFHELVKAQILFL